MANVRISYVLLPLHPFNGLFSGTTWVSRYEKGKTSLDLNETTDDGVLGWQWHQLDHTGTICTSLQTDNHTNTSSLNFYRPDAFPDTQPTVSKHTHTHTHRHTHTRLTALFPGLPRSAGTRKVKPSWILLKQEIVSGSGINWAICMCAPCSRQITTPTPHHSVFTGWMPFLPPSQQCQSTEGKTNVTYMH